MSSPACTELEVLMMDWLGKMLDLPPAFLSSTPNGHGGGVIQGTASETTFVALLGAKAKAIYLTKQKYPEKSDAEIVSKLLCYGSRKLSSMGPSLVVFLFCDKDKEYNRQNCG